jgi:hypothetical protein
MSATLVIWLVGFFLLGAAVEIRSREKMKLALTMAAVGTIMIVTAITVNLVMA